MKRPQPNIESIVKSRYIDKLAFVRKFIRYWGTTTVNGTTVLNHRKIYYPSMDNSTKKLTRFLGMYNDIKDARMKGVDKAWLYLNPLKDDAVDLDKAILASNLDKALSAEGQVVRVILGPKVTKTGYSTWRKTELTDPAIDTPLTSQPDAINEFISEYSFYWDNEYIISSNKEVDPYLDTLAKYIIFSNDIPYTVTKIEETYTQVDVPYLVRYYDDVTEQFSTYTAYKVIKRKAYAATINIPNYSITEFTDIVTKIFNDVNSGRYTNFNTMVVKSKITSPLIGTYDETADNTYTTYIFDDIYSLWEKDAAAYPAKYYLKLEALTGNTLTLTQKISLITSTLDSDYDEEDRDWWEDLVVIIIFVIAFYVTYNAQIASGVSALVAASAAITAAALVVSITGALASELGYEGIALASSKFLKGIAPLVTLASIISVVSAITNAYKEGARRVAEETGKELAQVTTAEAITEAVTMQFDGLFTSSFTDVGFDQVTKSLNYIFDAFQREDMRNIQNEIRDERAKIAELEEAKEQARTRNLLMDFAFTQFNVMNRDYSYYDSIYDRPYERWSTPFHIGNIQANSVSALWLQDAKDGII